MYVQLELDCSIGCVHIHLSPRLVHLLLEIASGLLSPGRQQVLSASAVVIMEFLCLSLSV